MSFEILTVKPHPSSSDHVVVVFRTKVEHQLALPKDVDVDSMAVEAAKYLWGYCEGEGEAMVCREGYEDVYPETSEAPLEIIPSAKPVKPGRVASVE